MLWLAMVLYSFALGTRCSRAVSVAAIAGLVVGPNLSSISFNPVPEMLIAGPWLVGLLGVSRRRAARQLAQQARELDAEHEAYAAESVRYEPARIARELHDIVAHCVSLMVVQASAVEKLAATDLHRAGESFTSIVEAARQASDEITLLVQLLAESPPDTRPVDLRIVEDSSPGAVIGAVDHLRSRWPHRCRRRHRVPAGARSANQRPFCQTHVRQET
jgi:signal transduction histidine kinase